MKSFVCLMLFLIISIGVEYQLQVISIDNSARLQLVATIDLAQQFDREAQTIIDLDFNHDGSVVAFIEARSGDQNGNIWFFETSTLPATQVEQQLEFQGTRLEYDDIGERFVVSVLLGTITVFDADTLEVVETQRVSEGGGIRSISISPDGNIVAVGTSSSTNYSPEIFYLAQIQGEPIVRVTTQSEPYGMNYGTAFFPLGDRAVYAGYYADQGDSIWVFDTQSGQQISMCGQYRPFTDDIVVTEDGNVIYSAEDGIRVWDARDCNIHPDSWHVLRPAVENLEVFALDLHPTQPILAIGYRNKNGADFRGSGFLELWDFSREELLLAVEYSGDYTGILSLAFSPDGTLLATGGADGTVRLWGIPADE